MNDPMVRRVNALVTTFLDALAILAIAAGVGWATQPRVGWAGALFFAGCILATLSMVAQFSQRPARVPKPTDDDTVDLPGPTDPGNLHVMGR